MCERGASADSGGKGKGVSSVTRNLADEARFRRLSPYKAGFKQNDAQRTIKSDTRNSKSKFDFIYFLGSDTRASSLYRRKQHVG